jgi:Leucine-rich repeat (LRR) protein
VLLIDLSSQSFYFSCREQKKELKKHLPIFCNQAYLTNKTNFELVLSPKNVSSKDVTDIYLWNSRFQTMNNLTRFPSEMFDVFPKMLGLQIAFYTMESIVFDDSMAKLEDVFIFQSGLKSFKSTLTSENAEISFLNIFFNELSMVDKDTFKGMNDMRELSLSCNKISSVHHESFVHMKMLKKINLSANPLKSLAIELVQSFPANMDQINLAYTRLAEIPNGAFKNYINLTVLSLFKNNLKTFIARDLDLSYCKTLDLGNNTIEQVNFEGLKGLEELKLDNNLLTTFNASDVGLSSCEDISLSKNNLTDFNLANVENLEEVYMDLNKLTTISSELFPQDATLKNVSFQSNQITSVDKKILDLLAKPDLFGLALNPCTKKVTINGKDIFNYKQCFKNFEKEKAMSRMTIMEN